MRIVDLFVRLILPDALWAAWWNWRTAHPAPACGVGSADTCPHCGQAHPPGPVVQIYGDGVSIEDYFAEELVNL